MSSAAAGAGPHIVEVGYAFPSRWHSWTPGPGIEAVAAQVSAELADPGAPREHLRRSVVAINADLLRKGSSMRSAIWVPDSTTGEITTIMDMGIREFPHGRANPEAHLARDVKRDLGRRTKLLEYAGRRATLAVGEATIEQLVLRLGGERQIQGYLLFLLFPNGAYEALSLMFNTVHLNLLNAIAEQARIIADSLTVTLGEIPGGRPKLR